jgi:hypothetical protein
MALVLHPLCLCAFRAASSISNHSWPGSLTAPTAGSPLETMGHMGWGLSLCPQLTGICLNHAPGCEGSNTPPASAQRMAGGWALSPLCLRRGYGCHNQQHTQVPEQPGSKFGLCFPTSDFEWEPPNLRLHSMTYDFSWVCFFKTMTCQRNRIIISNLVVSMKTIKRSKEGCKETVTEVAGEIIKRL